MARDLVQDVLDGEHALRPAEPAKRGVRLRVRLAAVRDDAHVRQVIAVVGVHHGPVVDRPREVGGEPAPRGEHQLEPENPAGRIEADVVVEEVVVALAGDHDVVVPVVAHLDRTPETPARDRRRAGGQPALRLLAAEPAAHAPTFDRHPVGADAQRVRHLLLRLARVLRRVVHEDPAVLARHREGDLALQVELFLPADAPPARQPVRGGGQGGARVAALERHGRQHERALRERILDREDGRELLVLDARQPRRAARLVDRRRDDEEDRLADVLDLLGRENRIVVHDRADVIAARDVCRGIDGDHPGRRAHRREIERAQPRVRTLREPERAMQRPPWLADVIDVGCLACHVQMSALVANGISHAPRHAGSRSGEARFVHVGTPASS